MTTHIRFLHVMKQADHLEQALRQGLMFTGHRVVFKPFTDEMDAVMKTQTYAIPRLVKRAESLGAKNSDLNALAAGLGSISGEIPMICFTEVHGSRDLTAHYLNFGAYGVVVSREWLERNGGDRVLYTGPDSEVAQRLHRLFIDFQIAGMHVKNGKVLLESSALDPILNLFAYVQGRDQLAEVEWRIAGEHGFTGRPTSNGKRIHLPLADIETVLVQNSDDVPKFKAILKSLPDAINGAQIPSVRRQPKSFRSPPSWYK